LFSFYGIIILTWSPKGYWNKRKYWRREITDYAYDTYLTGG